MVRGGDGTIGRERDAVPGREAVRAVNALTARWAGEAAADGADTVLSAVGVWPLLAFLCDAAGGAARAELQAALGVPAQVAASLGRAVHDSLGGGAAAALGIWADDEVRLRDDWLAGLPAGVAGRLTGRPAADQASLDAWAARGTGGLIPEFPLALSAGTKLVLASALSVETAWEEPFRPAVLRPSTGPWAGRDLAGLGRTTADQDQVSVVATPYGPLTDLVVRGTGDIDVHLLLGRSGQRPGEVIAAGVHALAGGYPSVPGTRLPEGAAGPGVDVTYRAAFDTEDRLDVRTPAFTVAAGHDLMARAALFGLVTAADRSRGHFPGMSDVPLAVGQARQTATASFSARGFRAAAVTAFAMMPSGIPAQRSRTVEVVLDRPFGCLAVHRATGLVVVAGWVDRPEDAARSSWPR